MFVQLLGMRLLCKLMNENLFIVQVHQLSAVPGMVRGLVQYFSMMLPALDLRLHCFHAAAWLSDHITAAIVKMLLLFVKY